MKPGFRRGTTPDIEVKVGEDYSDLTLHLSFRQGDVLVVKKGGDIDVHTETVPVTVTPKEVTTEVVTSVSTRLTQEDTLSFTAGSDCEVQIRGYKDGGLLAAATTIGTLAVYRILEEGVLPNAD